MARAQDPNSANSQFYIMFAPRLNMDRNYTVFGRVVSGMNFVDAIERGEPPPAPSRIVRASIGLGQCAAADRRAAPRRGRAAGGFGAAAPARAPAAAAVQGPAVPPPPSPPRALEPVRARRARRRGAPRT